MDICVVVGGGGGGFEFSGLVWLPMLSSPFLSS